MGQRMARRVLTVVIHPTLKRNTKRCRVRQKPKGDLGEEEGRSTMIEHESTSPPMKTRKEGETATRGRSLASGAGRS